MEGGNILQFSIHTLSYLVKQNHPAAHTITLNSTAGMNQMYLIGDSTFGLNHWALKP